MKISIHKLEKISPENLFFRVRHREFTFQWAYGIALQLRAIGLLSFCRNVYSSGVRSFRYEVVSIQVDPIQIEVAPRHHQSRPDTRRKSIPFNSIFMLSTV